MVLPSLTAINCTVIDNKTANINEKKSKRYYYSASCWHLGDVMGGDISFLWFFCSLWCVAINSLTQWINCSFLWFNVKLSSIYNFLYIVDVFTVPQYTMLAGYRCVSVCVCLSVALRYCIKMAKRRLTQIMPHDSPGTLVSGFQKSQQHSNGITSCGGAKRRWGRLKLATFDE